MSVKIKVPFFHYGRMYLEGETAEFDDKTVQEMLQNGLVVVMEDLGSGDSRSGKKQNKPNTRPESPAEEAR